MKICCGYFMSQISKWKYMSALLSVTRGLNITYIKKKKKQAGAELCQAQEKL